MDKTKRLNINDEGHLSDLRRGQKCIVLNFHNDNAALRRRLLDMGITKGVEIEIDGLLVDDTKTKAGKDFYDLFYNNWEAPTAAKNYTITVSEKPFRLNNTMIAISINENLIYQAILQPRQDAIEAQTSEAIYMAQDYLTNYEEIMKQINGDDLSGSGIY